MASGFAGRRRDAEWWAAGVSVVVMVVGATAGATLLTVAGALGVLTAGLLWVWQRECLTGVSYRRTLEHERARFGEELALTIELANDKVLPLTWLHVVDQVPPALTIRGGVRSYDQSELHQVLPMLPYQRVRRRLTVVCDRRGEYRFGPVRLTSANPAGYRRRSSRVADELTLLVYPKVWQLVSPEVGSRVPLGDRRSVLELIGDPSRPVGVREYRPGDPLRHIDWRATARSAVPLVRVFEPTAALRVAVFADVHVPRSGLRGSNPDVAEFTIALTASVLSALVGQAVATGLYSTGTLDGRPLAMEPSSSPTTLPALLAVLARSSSPGLVSIAELMLREGTRLSRGAAAVVIASDFTEATVVAMTELRRRLPITAIWVAAEHGRPPPRSLVDVCREVTYVSGWTERDVMELAS